MRTNLAIVSNYPKPTDYVDDAQIAFDDCIEGIKRVLTRLEKTSSARSTLRTFDYIVRQFVVYGGEECPWVEPKTYDGAAITALIKIMQFSKGHEATVTAIREIQETYRGTLNAAGVH